MDVQGILITALVTAILVLACAARAQQSTGEGHSTAHAAATVADWAHARNDSARAFSAAMEGRKAETLAAVQSVVLTVPLDSALATGSGWNLTQQYAALVRFGLWDELLALRAPDPRASGLTAGYLYGRGVALAARGRLGEARTILGELQRLGAAAAPDARAGTNT
ncbi:MAG: hypothetical protein ACRETG_09005, partial [Steroidobacteraceae bacterium]